MNLCRAISTGLRLVDSPCAQFCFPSSRSCYLSLTLFFPRLKDWSFRDVDHLHDNASQVSGPKVSPLPSNDFRGDWLVRSCALDPWTQCVRNVADDEKSVSLYSGKSRLPSIWYFVLCGKSPNFSHERKVDPNTCGSEDQISRKSISWQIRPMGLPFDLSHPGGMRRCGPVDGVSGCLRLCSCKPYLLFSLNYVYTPSMELLATGTSSQTLTVR